MAISFVTSSITSGELSPQRSAFLIAIREGTLPVLDNFHDRHELLAEAQFYGISDIVEWCGTEDALEASFRHQQLRVLEQYAINIKRSSMQRFRDSLKCYDTLVMAVLRIINNHVSTRCTPWLVVHVPSLFDSPELAPHRPTPLKIEGEGQSTGEQILACIVRCLSESMVVLGFATVCDYNKMELQIDLWAPRDDAALVRLHGWQRDGQTTPKVVDPLLNLK
eukprot:c9400_g1_i1.p1 GENE.c9400_g1_i1~~c9400_g1_i1.p1  ORF type:complete len:222 (-),score=29.37 c9400_g1_i1:71-736(-)